MRSLKCLPFIFILISPPILLAAEQDQHRYTQKNQIEFSEATRTAFDHSGKIADPYFTCGWLCKRLRTMAAPAM